jgi:hypothetical protein
VPVAEMFVHVLRAVVALGSFAAASWTIVTVARLAAKWHRGGSSDEVAALEERIARVEHAVEALTVDSGRLIDGQRFLSQLLAERSGAAQPAGRIDRP